METFMKTARMDPELIGARAIYLAVSMQNYEDNGPRTPEAAKRYQVHAAELTGMLADRAVRAGLLECCSHYPVAGELYKSALLSDHIRRNREFLFPELDAFIKKLTTPPSSNA
jgi:hypothetical protein